MREVNEDLSATGGKVLPLFGEANLAADLNARSDETTGQAEFDCGKFGASSKPTSLVHRQVDLPVGPSVPVRRKVENRVPPDPMLKEKRTAEQMNASLASQLGDAIGGAIQHRRVEIIKG